MNKSKLLISTLCLIFIFGLTINVLAIGQVTEPIVITNALRGQDITDTLTLLGSENKEVTYGLRADGQIAGWATFYKIDDKELTQPITEIKIPASAYLDATVKFSIPKDAPNGEYKGEVVVSYTPTVASTSDQKSSTVSQEIGRDVSITVSDKEMVKLDASVIPEKYNYTKDELLNIRIIYDNQSNISLTPQAQIKIKNKEQTVYSVIYPYPDSEPAVKTLTQHEIPTIKIPLTNLTDGDYIVGISFLHNNQSVLEKKFSFTVSSIKMVSTNKIIDLIQNNLRWWLWLIVIILIVSAIVFFRKSSKLKKDLEKNIKRNVKIVKKKVDSAKKTVTNVIAGLF